MQGQLLRERTPASGEWQVNALNLWGSRVDGGKGGILGQHSPQAAGALARLGKLGDGSARRDVVATGSDLQAEALAVGLGGPTPGL
jgi:hypothetical protein